MVTLKQRGPSTVPWRYFLWPVNEFQGFENLSAKADFFKLTNFASKMLSTFRSTRVCESIFSVAKQ